MTDSAGSRNLCIGDKGQAHGWVPDVPNQGVWDLGRRKGERSWIRSW